MSEISIDPPYHTLGYPPLLTPGYYDPLLYPEDPNQTAEEHTGLFASWVAGYYNHAFTSSPSPSSDISVSDLNISGRPFGHDALRKPTLAEMSMEEQAKYIYPPEGSPGGCDNTFLMRGIRFGLFNSLRKRALYLKDSSSEAHTNGATNSVNGINGSNGHHIGNGKSHTKDQREINGDEWPHLEVLHVWCDQSVWVLPYAVVEVKAEIDYAKRNGKVMRDVAFIRLNGVNHLVSETSLCMYSC